MGQQDHRPRLLQDPITGRHAAISLVPQHYEDARGHAANVGQEKYAGIYLFTPLSSHGVNRDIAGKPEHRYTLLWTLFKCLWRPNLDIVLPRILLTVVRYCQPLLISRTIAYISSDLPLLEDRNEAFRLILLTFIIYTGMAVRPSFPTASREI